MSGARERLTAALPHFPWCDEDGAVDDNGFPCVCHPERERLAAALLPVVQALVAEGKAEALEAAAEEADETSRRSSSRMFGGEPFPGSVSAKDLRARAAALRATTSGEGTT